MLPKDVLDLSLCLSVLAVRETLTWHLQRQQKSKKPVKTNRTTESGEDYETRPDLCPNIQLPTVPPLTLVVRGGYSYAAEPQKLQGTLPETAVLAPA